MKHAPVILALLSSFGVCRAASPPAVPQSLLACSELKDLTERAHCYDTQIAALKAAGASAGSPVSAPASPAPASPTAVAQGARASAQPAAPAPATAPSVAATPTPAAPVAAPVAVAPGPAAAAPAPASVASAPTPAAKFGEELLPSKQRPTTSKDEQVLVSSITAVRQVRPKTFLISLANGQTWLQEGSQITIFFRAGNDARIEKGVLGSYRMSTTQTGEKNWVRVTRLQ